MKILLTAFEAFDQRDTNASMEVVLSYDGSSLAEIVKVVLPVTYNTDVFEKVLKSHQDVDIILLTGEAINRSFISLEKIALNFMDATIPDNDGIIKKEEDINPVGENAYKTTLNLTQIIENMNLDYAKISYYAGTFICNLYYYKTLEYISKSSLKQTCLFIHFPLLNKENTVSLVQAHELLNKLITEIKNLP